MQIPAEWRLLPLVGGGPVRFGMSYDDVVARIGPAEHPPDGGTPGSPSRAWWGGGALALDFSPELEFVELTRGGPFRAVLLGIDVFDEPADVVVRRLSEHGHAPDPHDPELGRSYVYPELQASFWRPTVPGAADAEPPAPFSTVAVGAPGYYG